MLNPLVGIEKLAAYIVVLTSVAGFVIAVIELPTSPSSWNVAVALILFIVFCVILAIVVYFNRSEPTNPPNPVAQGNDVKRQNEQETRLREEFPRVYAFLDSVDEITSEGDFNRLETEMDLLIETETRHRREGGWADLKDREAIRAIALATLLSRKRFGSSRRKR